MTIWWIQIHNKKLIVKVAILSFLLSSSPCLSQENFEYIIDFDEIEYPVYYEGESEYFTFSKRGDTLKAVRYERSLLIDKIQDTLILMEHYNGVRIANYQYKFHLKQDVEFFNKREFLNFPEHCKLLLLKENKATNRLKLSRRKFIGDEELRGFEKIDTLFSYSERIRSRTIKKFQVSKKIFKVESRLNNIDFFAFKMNRSYEDENPPDMPDNPPRNYDGSIMKRHIYYLQKANEIKIGLVRIKGRNFFDLIVSEERRLSTSKYDFDFKSSLSRQTYRKKPVNSAIINKFLINK